MKTNTPNEQNIFSPNLRNSEIPKILHRYNREAKEQNFHKIIYHQVEDTEATAPSVPPPRYRAIRFQVLLRRGRHRHLPAPTVRSPLSPTSPISRPSSKGCRSPPRASYVKWPGRAAVRKRRGAPRRPRTHPASPASVVRF